MELLDKKHFSLPNQPKNILTNQKVVAGLIFLLLIAFGIAYAYQGMAGIYAILTIVISATIAVAIKSFKKRAFAEFDTSDAGITVNGTTYKWSKVKYYSWFGEKQSERIGAVGIGPFLNYDPINPYSFGKTQILELRLGILKHINLEIDSAQVETLTSMLNKYGVKHISLLRKIVGI